MSAALSTNERSLKPVCQLGLRRVHPEGFEPPTLGSEDRCAIQLCHGCILIKPIILVLPTTLSNRQSKSHVALEIRHSFRLTVGQKRSDRRANGDGLEQRAFAELAPDYDPLARMHHPVS